MRCLSFLQVGDIHYPDAKDDTLIDSKDDAIAPGLSARFVPNKLQNVAREMQRILDQGLASDGILICGDLTTRGDTAGYSECLEYLANVLQIGDSSRWPDERLHAVLGNHDVDRTATGGGGADLFAKFDAFRLAWDKLRPSILLVDGVRRTKVDANGCHAQIFSLNSCIGCGEKRHLPLKVKDQLYDLLTPFFTSAALNAHDFELIGEQLDTPAFLEEHVTQVVDQIRAAPANAAFLVLAHHGLLPQAVVRLAIYTELINGGLARFRFASCKRPVIFCHGHIHEDPIEIVRQARLLDGELVLISAPELRSGFNVINIYFSQSGAPIGCEIVPYRLATHGGVGTEAPIRVRLSSELFGTGDADPLVREILPVLSRNFMRFPEVVDKTRQRTGTHHQERKIEACLEEAEWLGLVNIRDRDKGCKYWHAQRVEP